MNVVYETSDELCHYRTKGSKNGIRRFQNKDGSLTPLGRIWYGVGAKRKGKTEEEPEKKTPTATEKPAQSNSVPKPKAPEPEQQKPKTPEEQKPAEEPPKQIQQPSPTPAPTPHKDTTAQDSKARRSKKLSDMTDDEIRAETARLNLESNYMTAIAKVTPRQEHTVKKLIRDISTEATKNIGTQLATYALGAGVNGLAKAIGYTNAQKPAKDKDGNPIYDDKGMQKMIDYFEDIVNPRKGQNGGGK